MVFALLEDSLALDWAGPAEALRIANQLLVARGQAPRFQLEFAAGRPALRSSVGVTLARLSPLPTAWDERPAWIVLVGQPGNRIDVSTEGARELLHWLRGQRLAPGRLELLAVCAGSVLAAHAGLLAGRHATTHHQHLEELAATEPACGTAEEHRPDTVGPVERCLGDAEVGVVAKGGERYQTREDHGDEGRAVGNEGAMARELLDREHDATQRGVEGRRDARRAAGHDEVARRCDATEALARQGVEYRGADLHRWAFAADRGAREQGAEGQQYLAESDSRRQQLAACAVIVRDRSGDRLGDAAALRAGEVSAADPCHQGEARGRNQQGQERGDRHQLLMGMNREVGADREDDTDEAGEQGRTNQQHASTPAPEREPGQGIAAASAGKLAQCLRACGLVCLRGG